MLTRRLTAAAMVALVIGAAVACDSAAPAGAQPAPVAHGGEWFVQTGCASCHSIAVYGVSNLAAIGPDLSTAVEDVPKRFGRSLEDFWRAPGGTMAMVLASRIPLDDAGRATAIQKLKEAYALHQQRNGAVKPVANH